MQFLYEHVNTAVMTAYPDFTGEIAVVSAPNLTFGDFATPVAFALGKKYGASPKEIAEKLAVDLQARIGSRVTVTVAQGAPFINFTLTPEAWKNQLLSMGDYLAEEHTELAGQRVIIEFISANPTGPLTLANGRGGFSGDAMGNVLAYRGATVHREYYYNDSGNQIMELGRSVVAARNNEEIEGGYKGPYIKKLAEKITEEDPYTAGQQAAEYISSTWIKPMIDRMGIQFDQYFSEQSLIDDGAVDKMVEMLYGHDLVYEDDGALWLKTSRYGDDKDRVLRRSNSTYTYLMKDIAYHWDKINRQFDRLITIVGADHYTEAKVLEMIVTKILSPAAGWQGAFEQPIIQLVRLFKDSQEVRMSKRAGNFVTIDDLLDEIPVDVARFFFLMRDLNTSMDLDLNLAKEQSDKNPVYYVQYAFVRAKHIIEKQEREMNDIDFENFELEERALAIYLNSFPSLVTEIAQTNAVHKLPHYAIELAKRFHAFYAKHPVLKAEDHKFTQRMILTQLTYNVLDQTLHLMGISKPDRMVQA